MSLTSATMLCTIIACLVIHDRHTHLNGINPFHDPYLSLSVTLAIMENWSDYMILVKFNIDLLLLFCGGK